MNNPYLPKPYHILEIFHESETEFTFKLERDYEINFGQFLQVSLPRIGEAPISVSDFGEGWLEMTIRAVGNLTKDIFKLTAGDKMFVRGPYGNGFDMSEYIGKHLVIAAGGTGLAPVRSMINHIYRDEGVVEKLDLLFGFKNPSSIIFNRDIEKWKEKFDTMLTLDEACGLDGVCEGLITNYVKDVRLSEFEKMAVIVIGPPVMMKYTAGEFVERGVPEEKIWVSFERNMSCALGKCGHCKIDETYVCLEGPVFNYSKAVKLID